MAGLAVAAAFLFPSATFAAEEPVRIRAGHPRLLVTDDNWGAINARLAAYGADGRELMHRLKVMAEKALHAPMIQPPPAQGDWLAEVRGAQSRLLTLALAYRLHGDARYLERVRTELRTLCGYPHWSPSHFLDTGEMALTVALCYDWLFDALPVEDRAVIRAGLMKHVLSFAEAVYATVDLNPFPANRQVWWKARRNNWAQVCHTGLLAAALAVAEDEPELARMVVANVVPYLRNTMELYQPDGGYPEGPGYWGYGTTYNVLAIAMLESATGSDRGLASVVPAFSRTAPFRLHMDGPSRLIYNYADAQPNWEEALSPAFAWLAARYRQPACIAFAWSRMRAEFAGRTADREGNRFFPYYFFWLPPPPAGASLPLPLDAHYRGEADVAVFRSAWGQPKALYLGFKAGFNGAGHGHLDLGSFLLDANGVRWSEELGTDAYSLPGYFGPQRWDYFRLNNLGHSTLLLNRTKQDPKATAPMVHFSSSPARAGAVADLTPACPGIVGKWLRGVWLHDRNRVLVQDELAGLAHATNIQWQMITRAGIEIATDGKTAILTRDHQRLEARLLAPAGAVFAVAEASPEHPGENPNKGYSIFVVRGQPEADGSCRIAVQLRPLGPGWPDRVPAPVLSALPVQ